MRNTMIKLTLEDKDAELFKLTLNILKRNGIQNIHPENTIESECALLFPDMDEVETCQSILKKYRITTLIGNEKMTAA